MKLFITQFQNIFLYKLNKELIDKYFSFKFSLIYVLLFKCIYYIPLFLIY